MVSFVITVRKVIYYSIKHKWFAILNNLKLYYYGKFDFLINIDSRIGIIRHFPTKTCTVIITALG